MASKRIKKRILYLGGFFSAEFSMKQSFFENGVEIAFLIDDNEYTKDEFWKTWFYQNYRDKSLTKIVPANDLENFIDSYKPDVIVHRYYLYRPIMYLNSLEIARRLEIPFIHLEMEVSQKIEENKDLKDISTDCDIFLYSHNFETDTLKYVLGTKKACYFYPYGVSSFERSIQNIIKDREIGGFGVLRTEEKERCLNLNMFLEGIAKLGKKLHVYGNYKYSPWIDFKHLEIHPSYSWEESTEIINRHQISINFETIANMEGAYSHKMFQTIGCGVPTLTFYKKSLSFLFGGSPNPLYVTNSEGVAKVLDHFLTYPRVLKEGEEFIHKKFDWWTRFNRIMKKEGVW